MKGKNEKQIAVIVGTVTDDKRVLEVPKLNVCALRFTSSARDRIIRVRFFQYFILHTLFPFSLFSLFLFFTHSLTHSLSLSP
jgi:hypothetical protein